MRTAHARPPALASTVSPRFVATTLTLTLRAPPLDAPALSSRLAADLRGGDPVATHAAAVRLRRLAVAAEGPGAPFTATRRGQQLLRLIHIVVQNVGLEDKVGALTALRLLKADDTLLQKLLKAGVLPPSSPSSPSTTTPASRPATRPTPPAPPPPSPPPPDASRRSPPPRTPSPPSSEAVSSRPPPSSSVVTTAKSPRTVSDAEISFPPTAATTTSTPRRLDGGWRRRRRVAWSRSRASPGVTWRRRRPRARSTCAARTAAWHPWTLARRLPRPARRDRSSACWNRTSRWRTRPPPRVSRGWSGPVARDARRWRSADRCSL